MLVECNRVSARALLHGFGEPEMICCWGGFPFRFLCSSRYVAPLLLFALLCIGLFFQISANVPRCRAYCETASLTCLSVASAPHTMQYGALWSCALDDGSSSSSPGEVFLPFLRTANAARKRWGMRYSRCCSSSCWCVCVTVVITAVKPAVCADGRHVFGFIPPASPSSKGAPIVYLVYFRPPCKLAKLAFARNEQPSPRPVSVATSPPPSCDFD